jgi:hypothetical protein
MKQVVRFVTHFQVSEDHECWIACVAPLFLSLATLRSWILPLVETFGICLHVLNLNGVGMPDNALYLDWARISSISC